MAITIEGLEAQVKVTGAAQVERENARIAKSLGETFGRNSDLGRFAKMMTGGGQLIALTLVTRIVEQLTEKMAELSNQIRTGTGNWADLTDKIISSLPIIGSAWGGIKNIHEMFTGAQARDAAELKRWQDDLKNREWLEKNKQSLAEQEIKLIVEEARGALAIRNAALMQVEHERQKALSGIAKEIPGLNDLSTPLGQQYLAQRATSYSLIGRDAAVKAAKINADYAKAITDREKESLDITAALYARESRALQLRRDAAADPEIRRELADAIIKSEYAEKEMGFRQKMLLAGADQRKQHEAEAEWRTTMMELYQKQLGFDKDDAEQAAKRQRDAIEREITLLNLRAEELDLAKAESAETEKQAALESLRLKDRARILQIETETDAEMREARLRVARAQTQADAEAIMEAYRARMLAAQADRSAIADRQRQWIHEAAVRMLQSAPLRFQSASGYESRFEAGTARFMQPLAKIERKLDALANLENIIAAALRVVGVPIIIGRVE